MILQFLLYVDPGSGYMLAQLITAFAGGVIVFKNRIISFFRGRVDRNETR